MMAQFDVAAAPLQAISAALKLIEEDRSPKSQAVVEAARLLSLALFQDDMVQRWRASRPRVFEQAEHLMDDAFGLGLEQARELIRTDCGCARIYDCAVVAVARVLEART